MPELPEVEVVRRGLERWIAGRTVVRAEVLHPRAVRRHVPGAEEFAARLAGRTIGSAERRGKYLWLPLDGSDAILAHLGMSGQLLVVEPDAAPERHLRIRLGFADGGPELRFVDQRTFGHVLVAPMTLRPSRWVPEPIAHIAADPFEDAFDDERFAVDLRRRRTEVKRALLDQSLISGVGNIYADEALWRARLHGTRPTDTLTRPKIAELLAAARAVMSEALAEGGTSFDSLYVNVNGESGYFERSLAVYGRRDGPCRRCGTPIVREAFMNRSSYSCPRCQPAPRRSRRMGS
ncbi:bifunctional DNA-formamidopyrimidine glycosylase/DNA-(apurinic or apyrimidinic site) lyase [Planomonospora sp. ID82291]|uniref:bifunctional DNA-formamidopyrimidine glycosylase/DNA-(apurinic or apyrimidinic site) lyase n=1 Tax=Planomonospora sp. ID82291 TaxID=2738136 RepID=UPI0018C42BD3|nr:bifunctional DNA-formamidopyrimidine glycosylase/DNA-(apurinic or apyrimidinic site) lyase [Planomonospora sp. ID82291]MBG0815417.1 bifunctional DNA-formamidopyrimidine glycosylase/DNA-(apurinic or apyrimidinic site) lyase [Planomonospora sp. ID82291]